MYDAEVQTALEITAEQKASLGALLADPAAGKCGSSSALETAIAAILTDAQKTALTALGGDPFTADKQA